MIILHFALCILHFVSASAQTQTPLYIVNGVEMESVKHIPEENIEHIDHLEANEATVAKYGERANNGVILITLRYDKEAQFLGDKSLADYVSERVKWNESWGVARYVARYTIEADGSFRLGTELESTDRQLRKRVLKVLQSLPAWQPATKQGRAVESDYVLAVQLPKGKAMPKEPYIVIR
ncbi:MAG: TonB-dependent receptor [Alistipes sp.]|nr:TonB-dependent receptor [Alistipes sp.]